MVQRDSMANRNEWFNYSNLAIGEICPSFVSGYVNSNSPSGRLDLIATAKLQLDGYDRFTERTPQYFRLQQPYDHHTTTPVQSYIYNYSIALRPEDAQPTGTLNASRIDAVNWQITMNPLLFNSANPTVGNATIRIYATNYNVFRVVNGFGGVLFTI